MSNDTFNIFDELATWAKILQPWEQCALKKLVAKENLDEANIHEIFAEFMYDRKLWVNEGERKQHTLELPAQPSAKGQSLLQLQKIREVKGVNALAPGQELSIGPNMTVIYGPNASGKSGYARVLKAACFTRSKDLEILGNIDLPPAKREKPGAEIVLSNDEMVTFEYGSPCPDLRDNLAVFDSSCIRVHTDEKNRFGVTPYLFDIFPRLVALCDRIQSLLLAEINKQRPDITRFTIQGGTSKVATALNSLSHQTNVGELETLAVFGDDEIARTKELEIKLVELKKSNRDELLKRLARQKEDIESIETKLQAVANGLRSEVLSEIKAFVESINHLSDLAVTTSAAQFESEPVQPIGGIAWRTLLQAALTFNTEAYPGKEFPPDIEDARCLLCQQPLTEEARDRLKRFFAYITSDTESKLKASNQQLAALQKQIQGLDLSFFCPDSGQRRTIEELDIQFLQVVDKLMDGYKSVRMDILTRIDNKAWNEVTIPSNTVSMSLASLRDKVGASIQQLKEQDTGQLIKQFEDELALLKDRQNLSKVFPEVKKSVESLKWVHKAEQCIPISHRHVTEKQKALMKDLIAKGFEVEFQANCKALNLTVPLQIRISGTEGATNRQLEFETATSGKAQPSQVLSEGEQTAVALADFLAEVKLNKSSIGMVFDDPVTSLDHMRKTAIAGRLVEEAKERQVVIFTHDIVFTHHLATAAIEREVPFMGQTVSRHQDREPGHVGLDTFPHPEYEKQTRERAQQCFEKAQKATGEERSALLEKGCASLRTAYEYFIQRTLFNDVVARWRENLKYTLSDVFFDEDIAKRVQERMEFLSRYIDAHSHSPEYKEVPLTPEILENEIKAFAGIRKDYLEKRGEWEKKRASAAKILS